MYMNERRRVAQFYHIRRQQNRDNGLITNTPKCEIPAQITGYRQLSPMPDMLLLTVRPPDKICPCHFSGPMNLIDNLKRC
jgi:hypothetical protein